MPLSDVFSYSLARVDEDRARQPTTRLSLSSLIVSVGILSLLARTRTSMTTSLSSFPLNQDDFFSFVRQQSNLNICRQPELDDVD